MRISDWSSDVCSSDLQTLVDTRLIGAERAATLQNEGDDVVVRHLYRPGDGGSLFALRSAHSVPLLLDCGFTPDSRGRRCRGRASDRRPDAWRRALPGRADRSEEHTSELQSLMRISYAVFCLKKKTRRTQ